MNTTTTKKTLFKIMVIGESGVGKTSILEQYAKSKFPTEHKPTLGVDFYNKEILIDEKQIQLQLWDTAGKEDFKSMGGSFFRGSHCCIFVYDQTNPKSFENIDNMKSEFLVVASPKEPGNYSFILIGNKSDKKEEIKVEEEKIRNYCSEKNMIYYSTSAKDNLNIETVFEETVKLLINMNNENSK